MCMLYSGFVRPSECTPEGQVAQLVEHRTENAGVAGSIPALATNLRSPPDPQRASVGTPREAGRHLTVHLCCRRGEYPGRIRSLSQPSRQCS